MTVLTMAEVLLAEAEQIHDRPGHQPDLQTVRRLKAELAEKRIEPDSPAEYDQIGKVYEELQRHDAMALCLSGGGIRSATFGLGVLEALAGHDLLAEFHYLSTVSGGGYIGSWLSAWIRRDGREEVFKQLKATRQQIERRPGQPILIPDREPDPLHALRVDSNYLTPRLGLLSADTWTGAALYLRNLLMNWAVIGSFILAGVLLPRIAAALLGATPTPGIGWALIGVAALLVVAALAVAIANRPTWGRQNFGQTPFLRRDLAPFFVAALAWVFALRTGIVDPAYPPTLCPYIGASANFCTLLGLGGAVLAAVAWVIGAAPWRAPASLEGWRYRVGDGLATAVAGTIFGLVLAGGTLLYAAASYRFGYFAGIGALILGPLWILQGQVIAEAFLVGFRSAAVLGTDDREWLGRSAGWYAAAGIGWALFSAVVLVAPAAVAWLQDYYLPQLLASLGGVSGIVTAVLGKSPVSSFKSTAKTLPANVILAIAAPIFALVLVIGLSALAALILYGRPNAMDLQTALAGSWGWAIFWCVLLAVVGTITSYFVNVNRFSLHSVYRNRLIRAYLGASNPTHLESEPPPTLSLFTEFDRNDNLHLSKLWPDAPPDHRAFLHVLGMTLNVVSTRNLAWQERKAEPFTATALHCGSDRVGFRATADYAEDLSLGTAMAISGAAASPSMGYHSSPALAFLLALFNVRLGWWLGNPANEDTYRREAPKLGAWWLAQEMLGLTTDDKPYVYLSDGGHFENLGLYEMVRRRCRHIVLCDAGCDPNYDFEDLGNAVRKIRIDLGIEIEFPTLNLLRKRGEAQPESPYIAIGVVRYPEIDPASGRNCLGSILYVKPGLHQIEPADVRSYAAGALAFPHESTADQWFSESQFESYRALGRHIMTSAIEDPRVLQRPAPHTVPVIIEALRS